MSLETTTRMLAPFLDRFTSEELDAIPYGVLQLDAGGRVISVNKVEADELGFGAERPIGGEFFTEIAPSAFVDEVFGRYVEAFASKHLDAVFRFTFSDLMLPRTVMMRMYYSTRTETVWIFTANPDGTSSVGAKAPCDRRGRVERRMA